MKIPSIVKGNDFTIKVYVYKPTYIDDTTTLIDFDLHQCSSINVFLVNGADSYAVDYTIDSVENNLIKVNVDFILPIGSYGIEITGKDNSGKSWRFKAKKGEFMNIIDATSGASFNNDLLEDGLYVTARIGVLGIDMDDYYDKEEIDQLLENLSFDDYYTKSEINDMTTIITGSSGEGHSIVPIAQYYGYGEYSITDWPFANINYIYIDYNYTSSSGPMYLILDYGESRVHVTIDFIQKIVSINEYEYHASWDGMYHTVTYEWISISYIVLSVKLSLGTPCRGIYISPNGNNIYIRTNASDATPQTTKTIKEAVIDLQNNVANLTYQYVSKQELVNSSYVQSWQLNDYAQNYRLNDYYTKDEINNAGYLQSHQSLDGYYTKEEINNAAYLQSHQSLEAYPTKQDISDASYVTSSQLSEMGYIQSHQSLDNYYTKEQINNAGYITSHQSLQGYATENYVDDKLNDLLGIDAEGITSIKNILEDNDTYTGILHEIVRKANSDDVYTKSEISSMGYLQSHQSLDNYYTKSDIESMSYVTQSDLSNMGYLQSHQSLDDYVTKTDLDNAGYLTSHQSLDDYVTKTELSNAGYVTGNQSLENYYTKTEINSMSYITSSDLTEMGYVQSLDDYYTKSDVEDMVNTKNNIKINVRSDGVKNLIDSNYTVDDWDMENIDRIYFKTQLFDRDIYEENPSHPLQYIYVKFDIPEAELVQYKDPNIELKDDYGYYSDDYWKRSYFGAYWWDGTPGLYSYWPLRIEHPAEQYESTYNPATSSWENTTYYIKSDYLAYMVGEIMSYLDCSTNYIKPIYEDNATYTLSEITFKKSPYLSYIRVYQDLNGPTEISYNIEETVSLQESMNRLETSLDNYYTKQEIQRFYYDVSQINNKGFLTDESLQYYGFVTMYDIENMTYVTMSDIENMSYVTADDLNSMGYLQSHQSLDNYYTKSDIESMSYVSQSELSSMGYLQSHQSLSDYYTKDEINNAGYLTSHQSLSDYVTKTDLDNAGYITSHQSLDNYYTKSDIESMSYVSQSELSSMGYLQSHQSLSDYYTKTEINNAGYLTSHQSLSDYVTKTDLDNAGYITSHQSLDNYYTKSDIEGMSYVSQSELSTMGYLQSHQSLSDYYTKTEINNAGYLTSHQSLSNYYTKSDIQGMSYVSQSELSAMGYLQSHQSLSDYYTKNEINNAGYLTSHQSLDNYATKSDLISYLSVDNLNTANTKIQLRTNGLTVVTTNNTIAPKGLTYAQFNNETNPWVGGTTLKNYVDGRLAEIEASYITSHQSLANYVTKTDLDNASYATISQLPVIDENIIPKQNNTYTLGNASNIYANTYSRGVNLGTGVKIFSESSATSENIAISLGGTSYYYINNNRFAPNGAGNSEKLDLGTSDRKWNGVYCKMLNTNVVNFQDGGWLRFGGNQNRLGIFSSTVLPGNNNELSLGTSTSAWKASYSYNYYTYNNGWNGLNETLEKTITSTTSGLKIEIVASMPASPDANTIYIVQ